MKKLFCILIVLYLLFAHAACQPSPTEDIVINKGDGDVLGSVVPFVPYAAPARLVTKTEEKNNCTIQVDAEVIVPTVTSYPVKQLEKFEIDDETVLRWATLFVGDVPLFRNPVRAKPMIQEEIQMYLEQMNAAKQAENLQEQVFLEQILDELHAEFKSAPETAAPRPLTSADYKKGERIWFATAAWFETGNNNTPAFEYVKNGQEFHYWRDDWMLYPNSFYPETEGLAGADDRKWKRHLDTDFEFTEQEAVALAKQTLLDMELTELSVDVAEKCCFIQNGNLASKGWLVYCTRSSGGLMAHFHSGASFIDNRARPVIGAPWDVERVLIGIDAEGIQYLWAVGLSQESGLLVSNTALLPFDALSAQMHALLWQLYGAGEQGVGSCSVQVQKMELRVANISKKDDREHGLLIPIWYITYGLETFSSQGDVVYETLYLSLDARDGGYIEPQILTSAMASYG